MRPQRSSSDRRRGLALFALCALLSPGCVLFSLEPPCRDDDDCDGARRCAADGGVCVSAPADEPDGGVD